MIQSYTPIHLLISVVSNCHIMEVCLVMAVLPLQGSSCFHLTAEPNFPNLSHTPWSCRKRCYQIFQHSILLLAFKSRNKSPGMYMLILPSPIKKMKYFCNWKFPELNNWLLPLVIRKLIAVNWNFAVNCHLIRRISRFFHQNNKVIVLYGIVETHLM